MKNIVCLLVGFMLVCAVWADEPTGFEPQWTLNTWWRDKYLAAMGVQSHRTPVLQAELVGQLAPDFFLSLWTSMGTDKNGPHTDYGDEVDIAFWKIWALARGITIEGGAAFYDLTPVFDHGGADLVCMYVDIGKSFYESSDKRTSASLFSKVEKFWSTNREVLVGGTIARIGVRASHQASPRLKIAGQVHILKDSGLAGDTPATLVGGNVGFVWRLNKKGTWELTLPEFKYADPITRTNLERGFSAGIGLTYKFSIGRDQEKSP